MSKKRTDVPVSRDPAAARGLEPGHWTGLGSLRDEIERLFDAFEPRLWFDRNSPGVLPASRSQPLCPAVDLTENGTGYAIAADLPGLQPDQISVKVNNGTMTISGGISEEESKDDSRYHLRERRWGSFERTFRLPGDVDRDKIEAQFSSGVLTISLPKSHAALTSERNVEIKAA
ncbi:Hsp20/alpha crystallin family protein [Poseidonocella sp. HB161398]|uniref:Hsp20/alpha crystallin family protein n=1 Tax=Poseidonocella sp. HB161398 TaxID=2320855 RepID=UPI00110888F6|nr:Hsp20/alpha crystallin family protein [Poseidonocella sp. HB161398]